MHPRLTTHTENPFEIVLAPRRGQLGNFEAGSDDAPDTTAHNHIAVYVNLRISKYYYNIEWDIY